MSLAPLPEVTLTDHPVAAVADSPAPPTTSMPASAAVSPAPTYWDDDVHLDVGKARLSGWIKIEILRGIEIMPSMFRISATDLDPDDASQSAVKGGDSCRVYIGSTLVITGYVDRVTRSIGTGSLLTVTGRSKCCDIVDCDVDPDKLPGMQFSRTTLLDMAKKLAGQYGVDVQALGNINNPVLPQINVTAGEKPWDVIERCARYAQVIAYDEVDGSLNLAAVVAGEMASGFAEGVNIERAQAVEAMDQRFSEIAVYQSTANVFAEIGAPPPLQIVRDKTVPRFRKIIVTSEQASLDLEVAKGRGAWEIARRYGRSQPVTLTTDSWRDRAGTLWHVNCLAQIDAPRLRVIGKKWLIAQVTFRRDEKGTHADLVLMPKQAFLPEPTILVPFDSQVYQGLNGSGGTSGVAP